MRTRNRRTPALRWEWAVCMVVLAAAAFPASLSGQEACAAAASPVAYATPPPEPDDPAYELYRQGYSHALSEEWEKARKAFSELQQRYPGSAYADDAAYWTAVSWKRSDKEKAAKLYRALLRNYPRSPYIDDAVADLKILEVEHELARIPRPPAGLMEQEEIRIRIPRELERLQKEFQKQAEQMSLQQSTLQQRLTVISEGETLLVRAPSPFIRPFPAHVPHLDPEVRTRIEAMRVLTDAGDHKETSRALREVALDRRQPVPVRITAVYGLGRFTNPENASALLEVARADSDTDVQRTAIEMYARSATNKKMAVDELIAMFKRLDTGTAAGDPRLGTALFSIATIGDERATDFLADIARSHRDEDLRSTAVFYLGTMGTERSRSALIRVLRGE